VCRRRSMRISASFRVEKISRSSDSFHSVPWSDKGPPCGRLVVCDAHGIRIELSSRSCAAAEGDVESPAHEGRVAGVTQHVEIEPSCRLWIDRAPMLGEIHLLGVSAQGPRDQAAGARDRRGPPGPPGGLAAQRQGVIAPRPDREALGPRRLLLRTIQRVELRSGSHAAGAYDTSTTSIPSVWLGATTPNYESYTLGAVVRYDF